MTRRSILPSFLRRESSSGRLSTPPKRPGSSLPTTPAIDPWMSYGASLVELARMTEEVVR
ncbi:MAG: hypothetical protein ACRBN8_43220 [Nannocystales bacterium]